MSDTSRETLAELLIGTYMVFSDDAEEIADKIIGSEWLAEVRREAAAQALEEMEAKFAELTIVNHTAEGTTTTKPDLLRIEDAREWLRFRATALRQVGD